MRFFAVNIKDTHVSIYQDRRGVWNMDVPTVVDGEVVRLKMRITDSDRIALFKAMKGKPREEGEKLKQELAARYKEQAEKDPYSGIIAGKVANRERRMSIIQYSSEGERQAMEDMTEVLKEIFKDSPSEDTVLQFSKLVEKLNGRVNNLHERPDEKVQMSGCVFPAEMEKLASRSLMVMLLLTNRMKQYLEQDKKEQIAAAEQQAVAEVKTPEHQPQTSQIEYNRHSDDDGESEGETEEEKKRKEREKAKVKR